MGIFSDFKAVRDVQKIKNGKTARLSISQIVNMIINLPDAKRNLPEKDFSTLLSLYQHMQKDVKKTRMDYDKYVEKCLVIINTFDTIAPYEQYSGTSEREVAVLMEGYYGKNHKRIRELYRMLYEQEDALREIEGNLKKHTEEYKGAYSDSEVKSLVQQKKMTQTEADDYLLRKKKIKAYIEFAPHLMRTTIDNIHAIKEWISDLEADS
jgi:hypothetical protein